MAQDKPLALDGLDPVLLCSGKQLAGDAEITATHGRFAYRFANTTTRKTFLDNPGRWCIQLDGACGSMPTATGVPDRFAVVNEHIYIFGSDECRTEFVAAPASFLQRRVRTVAILVFEGVELLDFAGPGEVFSAAGQGAFDVFTVAATREPVVSQGFLTIVPQYSIESAPMPDILVVPGGGVGSVINNAPLNEWIKTVAADAEHVVSVCNGALVLGRLGMLDGLNATTHFGSIARLEQIEGVTVLPDARFVDNGKIITTAGVSAGIDGSLHLVRRLLGYEQAAATARYMQYDWKPEPAAAHVTQESSTPR